MFKLDLGKAEKPEIKLSTYIGSKKKQQNSRKTYTSTSLTLLKPLAVWITTLWKILNKMGIPNHLTWLLRNLYAGQEATVKTGHGTTDWFQIGKGVRQGYILSPCLFNLYAGYLPCFILYFKAKFACYSRCFLTSYYCIPVHCIMKRTSFWGISYKRSCRSS